MERVCCYTQVVGTVGDMRSRNGNGRHRQAWREIACPLCGLSARARPTLPGKPMYIRTHTDVHGEFCPPLELGETRTIIVRPEPDPNQMTFTFDVA